MNDHTALLDKEICDQVQPGLYDELTALGVIKVLNMVEFVRVRKYNPCISSIFLVGQNPGGSYDFQAKNGNVVVVYNGSLVWVGGKSFSELSDLYESIWHNAPESAAEESAAEESAAEEPTTE